MNYTFYCGCETRSNRLKWAVFVVAALAGMAFLAAYMGVLSRCSEASRDLSGTPPPLVFTLDYLNQRFVSVVVWLLHGSREWAVLELA